MLLSVVIPALNEAEGIERCVASALALGRGWGGPVEAVVAEGGSTDDTADLATRAGATVIGCERGRGKQLRAGAAAASGDVVLMLHADATLALDAGRQLAEAVADSAVVFGAFRQRIDAHGIAYRWLEAGNAFRARRLATPYGDQAIFVRREALEAVGGVPDQPLMEDVELARRLGRRGHRPVLLAGPVEVSARRWREHGLLRQTLRNWSLLAAYRMGATPASLARRYAPPRSASQRLLSTSEGE